MSTEDEVASFITAYIDAWNAYDVPKMRAMWDETEAFPIYVAEESDPLCGWPAIEAYWGIDRSRSERLLTYSDLIVKDASQTTAIAFYHMRWNVFIPGNRLYPRPFGNAVRVSAHLRRRSDGWRLFHYIEAPLAALVQMRRAHEATVSQVFLDRVQAKGLK